MEYSKLVAVTGLPGLFELISSRSDGAVVRSLDDNKTQFIASRVHNFSHLESIEVYTRQENVNLAEVFKAMNKNGGSLPDSKDSGAIKKYFEKVYPEMDFEKVYDSDRKKMVKWFESLKKHKIEIKLSEPPAEEPEEPVMEEVKEEKKQKEKPAKKAAKEKTESPKKRK
jgi:hypothetical protein